MRSKGSKTESKSPSSPKKNTNESPKKDSSITESKISAFDNEAADKKDFRTLQ